MAAAGAAVTALAALLCLLPGLTGGAARPAVCQDDFLIREGTIIRTVDSRRRGARFLNNTEVGETARCLEACCDRAGCNAAIFDQKTRSCFLFDCGPLDDYRCLFTSHTQFVSATLRGSRAQLELNQWGSQTQHAAELHNLKNTEQTSAPAPAEHQKTLERPLKEIIRPPVTSQPPATKAPPPRCSRFQFECHSGECLAIYNACDGIPQCRDGSDEAAELDCPGVSKQDGSDVTERPPAVAADSKDSVRPPQAAPPPKVPQEPARQPSDDSGAGWERPRYNQGYSEPLPPGDIFTHRQQGVVLAGLSHFPAADGASRPRHGLQQLPPQPASYPRYEKPAYQPPYYDDPYQGWAGRLPSGGFPYDSAPRYDLLAPPQRAPFGDQLPPGGAQPKLSQMAPPANWPEQQPSREVSGPSPARPAPPPPPPPPAREDRPLSVDRRPTPQKAPDPQSSVVSPTAAAADGPAQNGTAAPRTEKQAEVTTPGATAAPPSTESSPPPVDEVEFSLRELRAQAALQASQAQGAAIVLTLGVLLSAVLLVMVLCRAQCVRQRAQRAGRPGLAHDADYLVNGMYL